MLPSLQWPCFSQTKNRHLFYHLPLWQKIMFSESWLQVRKKYSKYLVAFCAISRQISTVMYLIYVASLLTVTIEAQEAFLADLGVTKSDELSFKALYYTPIFNAMALFAITILMVGAPDKLWSIFDKYNIFAVSESLQLKYIMIALFTGLPDCIFDHYAASTLLNHSSDPDRYFWLQITHFRKLPFEDYLATRFAKFLGYLGGSIVFFAYILTHTLRYKPLLHIIYICLCCRHHLRAITSQLVLHQEKNSQGQHDYPEFDIETANQSRLKYNPVVRKFAALKTAATKEEALQSKNHDRKFALVSESYEYGLIRYLKSSVTNSGLIKTISSSEKSSLDEMNRTKSIVTLHQLDYHIQQLGFIVSDIDKNGPMLVFSMCLLGLNQLLHAVFFLTQLTNSSVSLPVAVAWMTSRFSIPFSLFLHGNRMEQEAKRLISTLELMYMDSSSGSRNSILYMQQSNMMHSLSRIFLNLSNLKFTCEGLMDINLGAMKKFLIYTATGLFIVIQYGKLS